MTRLTFKRSGTLGAHLEKCFAESNVRSLQRISDECDTHRNHLARIFAGEMLPRDSILRKIATAMGCDYQQLIRLRDEDEQHDLKTGARKRPVERKAA